MQDLLSPAELSRQLQNQPPVFLDASFHLPSSGRDAQAEYTVGHIPGARFLDLASLSNPDGDAPNAVPTAAQFAERLAQLGVAAGDQVVLYDDSTLRTSARAWFIFRLYGWAEVAILDGGLAAWRKAGLPLEEGLPEWGRSQLTAVDLTRDEARLRDKAQVSANLDRAAEQVVDARDAARFRGEEGSGSEGHIPGARNVPFTRMLDEGGAFKSPDAIREELHQAGVDLDQPIVTSCNSGVTACVVLFGARLAGADKLALYDGSWLDWGGDPATPKEAGEAA